MRFAPSRFGVLVLIFGCWSVYSSQFSADADRRCTPPGVFVVGVSRSGTSVAMSVLERLGAYLGATSLEHQKKKQKKNTSNHPDGIHEDTYVVEIDKAIYGADNLAWDEEPRKLSKGIRNKTDLVKRASRCIRLRFQPARQWDPCSPGAWWALKDPRFALTLPIWIAAAERVGAAVVVVFEWREPGANALSLDKHGHFKDSLRRWELLNRIALDESRSAAMVIPISYNDLISGSERRVRALHALGHKLSAVGCASNLTIADYAALGENGLFINKDDEIGKFSPRQLPTSSQKKLADDLRSGVTFEGTYDPWESSH